MSAHTDFVQASDKYAQGFTKGHLKAPPAKKLAIVTCMDARIDPAAHLGLQEGDAHIIRNAGGAAKDALRSLIISQRLLGTREIALFHHTDCGMLTFSSQHLHSILKSQTKVDPETIDKIDFLEFGDLEEAVKSDVKWLKENPLVLEETKVTGWVYEVETGKVRQVA
ncbi:hypothetical protein JAAARDRAFT_60324 [Jaapia argillacea MUCL 33604]|uniref:Carbonic anhydrase n=1 Tax=Jaapia argillacea MUCL 33604 TaxID=933084 RepID=A0A067PJ70_9AGAM|nr:hypothetical protein JAAARDRAFT_60324 [Jaapia argillacea MUCL 33604]